MKKILFLFAPLAIILLAGYFFVAQNQGEQDAGIKIDSGKGSKVSSQRTISGSQSESSEVQDLREGEEGRSPNSPLTRESKPISRAERDGLNTARSVEAMQTLDSIMAESFPDYVLVKRVFKTALRLDPDQATAWFERNQNKMEVTEVDSFRVMLATEFLSTKNFNLTNEWKEQIEDRQERSRIERKLWPLETAAVQQLARENPKETLEALVDGSSPYGSVNIMHAMIEWFEVEPDAAIAWEEQNRSTLPEEAKAHVSRAFAQQAIAQGDFERAQGWIDSLENPHYKKWMIERLNKAKRAQGQ